jgi:hypothetical protein
MFKTRYLSHIIDELRPKKEKRREVDGRTGQIIRDS